VARSFSGDPSQVQSLLKAAIHHKGTAILDIISPCVTFNNAPDSTKSYPYGKENEIPLHEIDWLTPDFVQEHEEILVDDYAEGEIIEVKMHDGSYIQLKKTGRDYDPRNRFEAIKLLEEAQRDQIFVTGLLYYEEPRMTLAETENLIEAPLAHLPEDKLRPSREALDSIMQNLM
jgi:2-oxoglutarate ferredoxin oxidoreductase subunit beta